MRSKDLREFKSTIYYPCLLRWSSSLLEHNSPPRWTSERCHSCWTVYYGFIPTSVPCILLRLLIKILTSFGRRLLKRWAVILPSLFVPMLLVSLLRKMALSVWFVVLTEIYWLIVIQRMIEWEGGGGQLILLNESIRVFFMFDKLKIGLIGLSLSINQL